MMLIVALIIILIILITTTTMYKYPHTHDQPLVVIEDNYLQVDIFKDIRNNIIESPLLHISNSLHKGNFKNITGIVIYIRDDGIEEFISNPIYKDFIPFFNKIRLPEANAFMINLLCMNKDTIEIGRHVDNTLKKVLNKDWLGVSYQTDVLYIKVPQNMQGGYLNLWQPAPPLYGNRNSTFTKKWGDFIIPFVTDNGCLGFDSWGEPCKKIYPKENMHVFFRGDVIHNVDGFINTGEDRISLVIEQYKLNDAEYKQMPIIKTSIYDHANTGLPHTDTRSILESVLELSLNIFRY